LPLWLHHKILYKKTLYRRKGKHQVFFKSSAIAFYFTALGPKGNWKLCSLIGIVLSINPLAFMERKGLGLWGEDFEVGKFSWLPIMFCTKVLLASFFSSCLFSLVQDASGDDQTHFGAAHYRLWVLLCTFWASNGHPISITDPKMSKEYWHKLFNGQHQNVSSSIFFEKNKGQAKSR